ncbi:hypothetical protein J6590_016615 [Homalodisca vitripennis]|nr:hypothetical protein J6590_016615 [Homalodisca vitripennis]
MVDRSALGVVSKLVPWHLYRSTSGGNEPATASDFTRSSVASKEGREVNSPLTKWFPAIGASEEVNCGDIEWRQPSSGEGRRRGRRRGGGGQSRGQVGEARRCDGGVAAVAVLAADPQRRDAYLITRSGVCAPPTLSRDAELPLIKCTFLVAASIDRWCDQRNTLTNTYIGLSRRVQTLLAGLYPPVTTYTGYSLNMGNLMDHKRHITNRTFRNSGPRHKGVPPLPALPGEAGSELASFPFLRGDMTRSEAAPTPNLTHPQYPLTSEAAQRSLQE